MVNGKVKFLHEDYLKPNHDRILTELQRRNVELEEEQIEEEQEQSGEGIEVENRRDEEERKSTPKYRSEPTHTPKTPQTSTPKKPAKTIIPETTYSHISGKADSPSSKLRKSTRAVKPPNRMDL